MFCQQCGSQIDDGLAFCTVCGAKQVPVSTADSDVNPPVVNDPIQPSTQPISQPNYSSPGYTESETCAGAEVSNNGSPKSVSFGGAIKLFFVNYVNFRGRSTASEYWWAFLFTSLVSLCTSWIPVVGELVALGILLPGLSLGIRRLHDTGKSWTYILMGLIPIAGAIILIIQYSKASDVDNKWGPAAKD